MFSPTQTLQACIGIASIILSIGGTWSMISGSIVKFEVAGANFSVNEKLEKVEKVAKELENTTNQLRNEPGVSPIKLEALEAELKQTKSEIESTETEVRDDLDKLVDD